ncbi:MAG: N-acyl-D-amino-acid deacylase family protein [Janthinobacterium lividum]
MHDLAIVNVQLYDGSKQASRRGALAVRDGYIIEVGAQVGPARETIDAEGLALAPGIIDTHTHYDAQITWDRTLDPSSRLGVTTVVIGNCGFTIAPCRPADRDRTLRNLTKVEGMPLEALREGTRWDFESVPQYLDMIEAIKPSINVAAFVGHSALRVWALGDEASQRPATGKEVEAMQRVLREAMRAGCIGLASSTLASHSGDEGVPMPSRLADEREFRALVGVLGELGHGVFMLTQGVNLPVSDTALLEEMSASTGVPIMIAAMLHSEAFPQRVFERLDRLTQAQQRGAKLYGQTSCCPLTFEFSMASPYVLEGMTAWKPALEASGEALKDLYRSDAFRQTVRDELSRPAIGRMFNNQWDRTVIAEVVDPKNRALEGRTIESVAREAGQAPLDWLFDFSLSENLGTQFTIQVMNFDAEALARVLRHPNGHIALSDAGAHLSFLCDAGFGLHLLGHWARDLKAMPLEEAVWQLSGRAAEIYGIKDRGRLLPGFAADLLLFDPARVGRTANFRINDLPGGLPRQSSAPIGVRGVWVNGVRILRDDEALAQERGSGRLLRDFANY